MTRVIVLCCLVLSASLYAGQVVVRKSSDPFDAFAVRDQVQRDFQWRESLRMQRQIQILQSLPSGCVLLPTVSPHYRCGGRYYRPYLYRQSDQQQQTLYIQVDPPSQD